MPSSLSIRIRDQADAAAVEKLKTITGAATASKALMLAARRFPEERERRLEAERQLETVRRDLEALRAAVRTWTRAQDEAREAAARLASIADQ